MGDGGVKNGPYREVADTLLREVFERAEKAEKRAEDAERENDELKKKITAMQRTMKLGVRLVTRMVSLLLSVLHCEQCGRLDEISSSRRRHCSLHYLLTKVQGCKLSELFQADHPDRLDDVEAMMTNLLAKWNNQTAVEEN